MPFVNRATVGAEFLDRTSSVILKQPQPQFLHARWIKDALDIALEVDGGAGFGLPGRDGIGADGMPYVDLDDMKLALEPNPMVQGLVQVVTELGKGYGHTVRLNRPVLSGGGYSIGEREVKGTISTTPIALTEEQVSLTLRRVFGPYDVTNTRVAPFGVTRFDATMAVHKLASMVGLALQFDLDKFLDTVAITLMDQGANVVFPKGMSTDDTSTVAGDYPFDWEMMTRIEKTMDDLGLPTFPDGRRLMVLTTTQLAQLGQDAYFLRNAEYNKEINPILNPGYQKSIGGWNIFKSTTLTQKANSSSVKVQYGQAIAPQALGVGAGLLPEVRTSTADNFGEDALVGWLAYMAFGLLDNRFVVSCRST